MDPSYVSSICSRYKVWLVIIVTGTAFASFSLFKWVTEADESDLKAPSSIGHKLNQIVESGPGVHGVKRQENGQLVSFIACGQAIIQSDAFGEERSLARLAAEEAATWEALAEAAEWLESGMLEIPNGHDSVTLI